MYLRLKKFLFLKMQKITRKRTAKEVEEELKHLFTKK